MNHLLLNKEVQKFISENYKEDLSKIIFRGSPFDSITVQELATQLTGKRKAEKKLPSWFKTEGVIYPPSLNLEQTSSEKTADYKASLLDGQRLIDLTGGFGIDSFYFSKRFEEVIHTELDLELSTLVAHNNRQFQINNIITYTGNGIDYLKNDQTLYDWIYVDPSRRDDVGGRVFQLSDCLPNVPANLDLLFSRSKNIMIKTSPLLDLTAGIKALEQVKEIHIVAVDNEVKELLWILEKDFWGEVKIETINFKKSGVQCYGRKSDTSIQADYSSPLAYLYEPNAALMKSGLFAELGTDFRLKKLHRNTQLFTSEEKKKFPGRRFAILEQHPYRKKQLKKNLNLDRAHIATRNFPESVVNLRKTFKLQDGGDVYVFFTTTGNDEKVVLICRKI